MFKESYKFSEGKPKNITGFSFAEIGDPKGNISTIQILKTGDFKHAVYGNFNITEDTLKEFKENFDKNIRGLDLAVDENHDTQHKAIGFFKEMTLKGNKLFAKIEWNKKGAELIKDKIYKYFSPELHFSYQDEETGDSINNVIVGGGITNRPFFKGMEALKMHEVDSNTKTSKQFYYINNLGMNFKELVKALKEKKSYTFAEMENLRLLFSELPEGEQPAAEAEIAEVEGLEETKETETDPKVEDKKVEVKTAEEIAAEKEAEEKEKEKEKEKDPKVEDKKVEVKKFSEDENKAKEFNEALKTETGLSFAEVKEMQKKFSEQANELKSKAFAEKVETLVFSESNGSGIINPAKKDKVIGFAMKLSENLAKEFFEILPETVKTFQFGEIGKTGDEANSLNFSVPDKTPEGVDRASFILNEAAKLFSEDDVETAMIKAEAFVKENNIK